MDDPAVAAHDGTATINGVNIRVMFDTGAYTSVLSERAAERAGSGSTRRSH